MKIISLLSILLALILVSCSSNATKDYEENLLFVNNINGSVESILSETFDAEEKFGEIQKGDSISSWFDFHIYTIISDNTFYEFTKQGKLKTVSNDIFTYYYDYDDSGNIAEENIRYSDTTNYLTKFKIEKDKIVSSISYDTKGEKITVSDFIFEGDLIKEIIIKDEKGTFIEKTKFSYENDVQTESIYNNKGELYREYKRDIVGRILEIYTRYPTYFIGYNLSYINEKMQFIYKEGIIFPAEIRFYKNDDISGKMDLSFDEKHNITEIKSIDEDGEISLKFSFTYKYDDNGNWIEQATYRDGELDFITTRKIEYYKN